MKKLYVGNLPFSTTSDDLKQMFVPFGEVASATIINDKFSGRSKGFGFVEMPKDEEAAKAIEGLNGKEMDGRAIVVNEARPMEDRPRRDFGGGDRGGRGNGSGGYGRRDR
ncbi:MAG: RNA-binding protein [Candidatus Brennerbacteria bacterium RIFOXYB1_FULL_41_13]|uniref:RNA-binding protein n=1 Tax=Candidatus Brennerbacteria bacterium RIFOXYD1_FULL_41_16 TaxID=1797529 RepID=A0A1G1XLI9_9BACT|nr:MAG: Glycine-rich RNA-binding protein 8 [Parcubacteria group bacterium GW2011_GWB1_41_4]OGY39172.1 MAG: RNA-binding protein [Candidatus Brennerbacteria bacterium RIFOXYB1_FULL_41_13]OGY40546.1 MAG: RNA-binding protein [Candidatus Brennerbacteria bacterium RIFOXYD1_FULL_41_16]